MDRYNHMCALCKFKESCNSIYKNKITVECVNFDILDSLDLFKKYNLMGLGIKDDRYYGALFGSVVGDALGVPVEFKSRDYLKENKVEEFLSYLVHGQPMGTWSDDTSMMLCLLDAMIKSGSLKCLDLNILSKNFIDWYTKAKFTATNQVFDVGSTCYDAIYNMILGMELHECGKRGERANGNGAIMRILPLAFCDSLNENVYRLVERVVTLTHNHAISTLGCLIYIIYLHYLYKGFTKREALDKLKICLEDSHFDKYRDYISYYSFIRFSIPDLKKIYKERKFKSSGFVVDTLKSALLCFLFENSYEDCVLSAVNLGDDTDTVGCVCGAMAGMYYGIHLINPNWVNLLQKKEYLYDYFSASQKVDFNV